MATEAQYIQTALANIARQLAEMTERPKPSYQSGAAGVSVSWGEHFNNLLAAQEKLRAQLQQAAGNFEVHA